MSEVSPGGHSDQSKANILGRFLGSSLRAMDLLLFRDMRSTLLLVVLVILVPMLLLQLGIYYGRFEARTRMLLEATSESPGRLAQATMAPLMEDPGRDAAYGLLITAFSLLIAPLVTRKLTIPIKRLQEHALAIGRGEIDRRVKIDGPAEIASWPTPSTGWLRK